MWKRIIGLLIPLLLGIVPVQAQSGVEYTRYDVAIEVHEDGRLSVREWQYLRFNGRYTEGFAEIPLDYVAQIRGISVFGGTTVAGLTEYDFIGSGPESYRYEVDDEAIYVEWEYAPTSPGEEMVFMLAYEVEGGLWVYDDMMTMEWRAIAADRSGLAVPESRVTVDLPFAVTADQLDTIAFGPEHTTTIEPLDVGQQVIFEATEPIADGTRFQVVVDFPLGLVTAQKQAWQLAADEARLEYVVDGVAVDMVVAADGRLTITENHQVTVQTGILAEGTRQLAYQFVDELSGFQVREGEQVFAATEGDLCDYCYRLQETARQPGWVYYGEAAESVQFNSSRMGGVAVTYAFPELVRGESSTFTLAYEAAGAFSVAADGHLLTWTAVPGEAIMPQEATITLHLPGGMGLEDATIEGATAERSDKGIVLRPERPLSPWQAWQFTLLLPAGTLNTTPPLWQTEFEAVLDEAAARQAEQAAVEARRQLAVRAGGIGVGLTAVLGAIASWYLWGSRKVREVMGNYRTTPPSDLPPGIVAYLLDNEATGRGALASLFYLADLGLIRLDVGEPLLLVRLREQAVAAGEKVITPVGAAVNVPGHAAILFNKLMEYLPVGEAVALTAVQAAFQQALPAVYTAMAQEMVTFFYGSGSSWRGALQKVLPLLWFGLMAWLMFQVFPSVANRNPVLLMVLFFGPFMLMGFLVRRLGQPKAALSQLGQQEVKKWQGFRAYLQDIQKYGDLTEAQEILDRYFAYAIALGVEESLLAQVEAWGGYTPVWVGNGRSPNGTSRQNRRYYRPWYRRGAWLPQRPSASQRPSAPQAQPSAQPERPSLQTISDSLTRSLNEASGKMTDLLNTAVGEGQAQSITIRAAGQSKSVTWEPGSSINSVVGQIMKESRTIRPPRPTASGGSGSSFRSSGGSRRSGGSRSSRSSSRSSSSRRSGGGGRRGFK
ncbi:MAG: DUF2207 domain-containing protein [Ardenticatenaceae bacterium]|nr:DUF2207 domain-containing protein [Ardenticatenaceae bacterium]